MTAPGCARSLALCLARLRETYREPEVLFWGFVFPLLLSGALAVAFRDRPPERVARGRAGRARGAAPGAMPCARRLSSRPIRPARPEPRRRCAWAAPTWSSRDPPTAAAPVEYRLDPSRPEAGRRPRPRRRRAAARRRPPRPRGQPRGGDERARRPLRRLPGAGADRHEPDERRHVGHRLRARRHAHQEAAAAAARDADARRRLPGGADGRRAWCSRSWRSASCWASPASRSACRCAARSSPCSRSPCSARCASPASASRSPAAPRKIETVSGLMNLVMMPMFVGSGRLLLGRPLPAGGPAVRCARCRLTALNDALRAVTLEGASLVSQADRTCC